MAYVVAPLPPTSPPPNPSSVARIIVEEFRAAGVSDRLTGFFIGLAGLKESGLNPFAFNNFDPSAGCPVGQAVGLFQLHTCGMLVSFYNAGYTNPYDARQQAKFVGAALARTPVTTPWPPASELIASGFGPDNPIWDDVIGAIELPDFDIWDILQRFIPIGGVPNVPSPIGVGTDFLDNVFDFFGLPDIFGPIQAVSQLTSGVLAGLLRVLTWITKSENWWRLGFVITGITFVIAGFLRYTGVAPSAKQVVNIATVAATKGKSAASTGATT